MATKQYSITWTFWMAFLLQVTDVCGNIRPTITSNTDDFEMDKAKTLTCSVTTSKTNSGGVFPLKWTKKSAPGVIIPATETTQNERGNSKLYTSSITFTVIKYMNGDAFICTARFGPEMEYATRDVSVYRLPDAPITRGPSVVRCGQTAVWTCTANGASFEASVLWVNRNGVGIDITKQSWFGSLRGDWANGDSYLNKQSVMTLYTIENTLTLTIGAERIDFPLYCFVSRYPHSNGRLGKAEVLVSVTGSCAG